MSFVDLTKLNNTTLLAYIAKNDDLASAARCELRARGLRAIATRFNGWHLAPAKVFDLSTVPFPDPLARFTWRR